MSDGRSVDRQGPVPGGPFVAASFHALLASRVEARAGERQADHRQRLHHRRHPRIQRSAPGAAPHAARALRRHAGAGRHDLFRVQDRLRAIALYPGCRQARGDSARPKGQAARPVHPSFRPHLAVLPRRQQHGRQSADRREGGQPAQRAPQAQPARNAVGLNSRGSPPAALRIRPSAHRRSSAPPRPCRARSR